MSKLTEIDGRIAELQGELERAQAEHAQCAVTLAMNPTDNKAVAAARKTSTLCKDLQADIDLMTSARDSWIAERGTDVGRERIEKAGELLKTVPTLMAQRTQAALEVDKTLAGLKDAVAKWVEVNTAVSGQVIDFFRTLYPGDHEMLMRLLPYSSGMGDCASNALAAQLDEALHGVKTSANIAFNYVRQSHDQPELVVSAAESSAALVLGRMTLVGTNEGVKSDVH